MKPPRFSLRGLLMLTACLPVFCYWRDRPRQIANRFVAAINARDYTAADKLISDSSPMLPSKRGDWRAVRTPQSPTDWLRGRCYVNVICTYTQGRLSVLLVADMTGVQYLGGWTVLQD